MIYGLEQHKWGTWNLWNLFPHNYPYIPNLLYYISNRDLCRFYRFYTGKNIKGLMKCLGKGSPGSTCNLPIKISGVAPLTPILHLARRNASRVPTNKCGQKDPKARRFIIRSFYLLGRDRLRLIYPLRLQSMLPCLNQTSMTLEGLTRIPPTHRSLLQNFVVRSRHQAHYGFAFLRAPVGDMTVLNRRYRPFELLRFDLGVLRKPKLLMQLMLLQPLRSIFSCHFFPYCESQPETNKRGSYCTRQYAGSSHHKFFLVTKNLLGGVGEICMHICMRMMHFMLLLTVSYRTKLIGDLHEFR